MKAHVVAKRWAHGWELHIEGEGVTQAKSLAVAEAQVRDYLSLMHDLPDDEKFDITIVPELGAKVSAEVSRARQAVAELDARQRETAALSRSAVRVLADAGLKGSEIAAVLKVSPQRVSQLVAPNKPSKAAAKAAPARVAAKAAPARRSVAAKAATRRGGTVSAAGKRSGDALNSRRSSR